MEIKITKAAVLKEKPDSSTLGFGKIFTDHMFMMDWNDQKGWYNARIVPFANISSIADSASFLNSATLYL